MVCCFGPVFFIETYPDWRLDDFGWNAFWGWKSSFSFLQACAISSRVGARTQEFRGTRRPWLLFFSESR